MSTSEEAAVSSGDVQVVSTQGELEVDLDNLEPLRKRLESAARAGSAVVLDAGDITFGDSSFLRILLTLNQQTDLRVAAPRPVLQRLFSVVGVDMVLKVYPSVAEAVAAPPAR